MTVPAVADLGGGAKRRWGAEMRPEPTTPRQKPPKKNKKNVKIPNGIYDGTSVTSDPKRNSRTI